MAVLVLGLVIFLGVHSLRIVAERPREALIARLGENQFKAAYSVLSILGLSLVIWGYASARTQSPLVWAPPAGLPHLALVLVPAALVLLSAAYCPPGRIRRAVAHPMALGVALWALAHLLTNGTLADVVLFGAFFAWALADYAASLARTGRHGAEHRPVSLSGDLWALAIGLSLAAALIGGLHRLLFGVSPLGGRSGRREDLSKRPPFRLERNTVEDCSLTAAGARPLAYPTRQAR